MSSGSFELEVYLPSTAGPRPVVVLAPGLLQHAAAYAPYGRRLASHGVLVLVRDDPGIFTNTPEVTDGGIDRSKALSATATPRRDERPTDREIPRTPVRSLLPRQIPTSRASRPEGTPRRADPARTARRVRSPTQPGAVGGIITRVTSASSADDGVAEAGSGSSGEAAGIITRVTSASSSAGPAPDAPGVWDALGGTGWLG